VQKAAVYCWYHPEFCELYCKRNPLRLKGTETWEQWRERIEAEPLPPLNYLARRESMPAVTGQALAKVSRSAEPLGGWQGWKQTLEKMAPSATAKAMAERDHPIGTSVRDIGDPGVFM